MLMCCARCVLSCCDRPTLRLRTRWCSSPACARWTASPRACVGGKAALTQQRRSASWAPRCAGAWVEYYCWLRLCKRELNSRVELRIRKATPMNLDASFLSGGEGGRGYFHSYDRRGGEGCSTSFCMSAESEWRSCVLSARFTIGCGCAWQETCCISPSPRCWQSSCSRRPPSFGWVVCYQRERESSFSDSVCPREQ